MLQLSGGEEVDSPAAIIFEPQAEVASAYHDRCMIAIKEGSIHAWLKCKYTERSVAKNNEDAARY